MQQPIAIEQVVTNMAIRSIGGRGGFKLVHIIEVDPPSCKNHVHVNLTECYDKGTMVDWSW